MKNISFSRLCDNPCWVTITNYATSAGLSQGVAYLTYVLFIFRSFCNWLLNSVFKLLNIHVFLHYSLIWYAYAKLCVSTIFLLADLQHWRNDKWRGDNWPLIFTTRPIGSWIPKTDFAGGWIIDNSFSLNTATDERSEYFVTFIDDHIRTEAKKRSSWATGIMKWFISVLIIPKSGYYIPT